MLKIYNTLTQEKEVLKTLTPHHLRMYVCGMTVYDYCHIGHARVWVFFDTMIRYLQSLGMTVDCVRNITDIDDKIIQRAHKNQEPFFDLTERFIQALHEDEKALGILPPKHEPRATQFIPQMIALIQKLLKGGYAYIAADGDVYFDVGKFKHYGALSHQDLEKLRAGERVVVAEVKHDPLDFVLWKMAKPEEPSWDSPWGKGRPGWHIECSAMSIHCLGEQFDIHGGGLDLIFPHHENEIAQSESATGKQFAHTWMHVGYVQMNAEKMSKSIGNIVSIRDCLSKTSPEVLRYFLISSHYRSPLNYTPEAMTGAHAALERFYLALRGLKLEPTPTEEKEAEVVIMGVYADPRMNRREISNPFSERFHAAMEDDFNTPVALAVLFDMAREINRVRDEDFEKASQLGQALQQLARCFGILQQSPEAFFQGGKTQLDTAEIQTLIDARNRARQEKNWALSDQIRQQLLDQGILLEDTASGTSWRRQEGTTQHPEEHKLRGSSSSG